MIAIVATGSQAYAQFAESGISAGFFDSSNEKDINFSEFHLPPLSVLLENAKSSPSILSLEKARQIAQAEVAKQTRHIFSTKSLLQAAKIRCQKHLASRSQAILRLSPHKTKAVHKEPLLYLLVAEHLEYIIKIVILICC